MGQQDIVKFLEKNPGSTTAEICAAINIGHSSVCRHILQMRKYREIEFVKTKIGQHYKWEYSLTEEFLSL